MTNPYIRTGISDPLGFLIESSEMTPYPPEQSFAISYPDTEVHSDLVNDSTVAARFSEYRDNHLLMSGAGATSLRTGRAAAAGVTLSGQTGARAAGAASSAFNRVGVLAPFAAGSSALAAQQSAMSNSAFVDPNAVVASLTSSAALGGVSASTEDMANSGGSSGIESGMSAFTSGESDPNADITSMSMAGIPLSGMVPPATAQPFGPSPGDVFPNVSLSVQSSTGFQDSTTGTAGLPAEYQEVQSSPLLASYADSASADSTAGPFNDLSSETGHFLAPTLLVGTDAGETGQESVVPLAELKRRARLHAMIYNPGAPLPSPFEERAMEKAYLKQQRGQQRHYPKLLAPSVTP